SSSLLHAGSPISVQNPCAPSANGFCCCSPHQSATSGIVKSTTPQLPPHGQGISYDLPVRLSLTRNPLASASCHCFLFACEITGSCDRIILKPFCFSSSNMALGFS